VAKDGQGKFLNTELKSLAKVASQG
jgi:hypothetical protein